MNAAAVARNYSALTPEERFRLIVAANDRGDEAESSRLCRAAEKLHLSTPDHTPWSHAFEEMATLVFIELLEEVSRHQEAFQRWSNADEFDAPPQVSRMLDLYKVQGFVLQVKIDGWKLFCERMSLPAFTIWEHYPGIERLKSAAKMVENNQEWSAAFTPEELLGWLHKVRPEGASESSKPITPELFADELDSTFRTRVKWWGG